MKLKYTKETDKIIKNHEEKMIKVYTNIVEKYKFKFVQFDYSLKLVFYWQKDFDEYSLSVHCRIYKNENEFIDDNGVTGEVDYHVLHASEIISRIEKYVYLNDDTSKFSEELERILDISMKLCMNK